MVGLSSYSIRARLFPAFIGIAPALALATITISWQELGLPQVITTAAAGVLFFVFADLARRFGRRTEQKFFASTSGKPFPTVLRHRDEVLKPKEKERYLTFLAGKLGENPPSVEEEASDPEEADAYYARCGNWLRERTRDRNNYEILFEENVTYGFRRNLYGLKIFGLTINVLVVMSCIIMIYVTEGGALSSMAAILVFAMLHAIYFIFVVTRKSVLDASDQYGRQLVFACENLMEEQ